MKKPNIIFIMSDDHASHAMSCYGSKINETPNIDRIANEGMKLNNTFCTNSICGPSRATILTGKYSHINGVETLDDKFDNTQMTFPKLLQKNGYKTAMIGKWHLGQGKENEPTGFDYWNVLPGQGDYVNPEMIEMGEKKKIQGYVTDLITDFSIDWMDEMKNNDEPFLLMCHHKAPHRPWVPDEKHADMYKDIEIPYPETFDDDYSNRASAAENAEMRIDEDLVFGWDLKDLPPREISMDKKKTKKWKYQQYIKDYLGCIASIDDNVGRILDYLDEEGLTENTIIVYTSDQGFFLGDHGWFDKRFFYEESLRMPFIVRYPKEIEQNSVNNNIILNTDFAPTFLDYAGIDIPDEIQGDSFRKFLSEESLDNWREVMYYHYSMFPSTHNVYPHYGVRTDRYKLIYYYDSGDNGEWELFDLETDPNEMKNQYNNPEYQEIITELKKKLYKEKSKLKDYS